MLYLKKKKKETKENLSDRTHNGMSAEDGTALNSTSSPLSENLEGTRDDVTDYGPVNATFAGNETSPRDEGTSPLDEELVESANASQPTPNSATSGNGSVTEVEIQRYEVDANKGLHMIHPVAAMSPGTYRLEIDYEAVLDGKVIYSESYGESGESGK